MTEPECEIELGKEPRQLNDPGLGDGDADRVAENNNIKWSIRNLPYSS